MAWAVPLLAMPIVSHLFSPGMFGQLAFFLSLVAIGGIAATGRYELAILIPRNQKTACAIAVAAVVLAVVLSLLSSLVFFLVYLFAPIRPSSGISAWVWVLVLPVGVVMTAMSQTLIYFNTRNEHFQTVARARAAQAISITSLQLVTGSIASSSIALIASHMVGLVLGVRSLLVRSGPELQRRLAQIRLATLLAVARRYSSFPRYLIVGHLANTASSQAPVLALAVLYGPAESGVFAFAERFTVIPSAVIAGAVGEVYRQKAAQQYSEKGHCLQLFTETKLKLLGAASILAIGTLVAAYAVIPKLLGSNWGDVAEVAAILSIVVFFQNISSPLSQTVYLAAMYRADLAWQIFRLVISVLAIASGFILYDDYKISILFYALAFSLAYSIHSCMQYRAARGSDRARQNASR